MIFTGVSVEHVEHMYRAKEKCLRCFCVYKYIFNDLFIFFGIDKRTAQKRFRVTPPANVNIYIYDE